MPAVYAPTAMKAELPREICPLQPMSQLSPKITIATAAPRARSPFATGGRTIVMARVTAVKNATPMRRECVDS